MNFVEKASLLVIGVLVIAIAAVLVGVVKVFPKYAPGEPAAVVRASYPVYANSALAEDYLGRGVWQVTAGPNQRVYFKVYEQTDTVEKVDKLAPPRVGALPGRSDTVYYVLLIANAVLLVAHIIFATVFWSKRRRIKAVQA